MLYDRETDVSVRLCCSQFFPFDNFLVLFHFVPISSHLFILSRTAGVYPLAFPGQSP
jgi:hypothetical protein